MPLNAKTAGRDSGIYYGWVVVVACNLIACITWGVGIFNQGVFVAYYAIEYGWSALELSFGPVIFHLWAGLAGVVVGRVVDRFGPRPALLAGAGFMSCAMLAFAALDRQWQVYPAFVLAGTGFACIHTVTLGKIISRWFVRQRGRAMAAATFGAGIGGAILVPANVLMIEAHGLLGGGLFLAIVTLVVIVPVAICMVRDGPDNQGPHPDSPVGPASAESSTAGSPAAASDRAQLQVPTDHDAHPWTLSQALRTAAFWAFALCFAFGMVAQSAYLFHQVSFLQTSLGMLGAASVVSITTLCGIAGRASFIVIGDRLPARAWVALVFTLQATAFLILATSHGELGLTAGSALFGLTMGVVVTLQPLTIAQTFGRTSFGQIYGPIYMAIRFGSAVGPLLVGILLELSGTYEVAWWLQAACLAFAVVTLRWATLPAGQPQHAS